MKGGKCEFAAYSINGSFAQIAYFAKSHERLIAAVEPITLFA